MATAVDSALAEVRAQLAELAPAYEGLQDFRRLNLDGESLRVVRGLEAAYAQRIGVLTRAADSLEALLTDGYPTIPSVEVDPAVMKDLQNNADTIQAALKRFDLGVAGSLGLSAISKQPK